MKVKVVVRVSRRLSRKTGTAPEGIFGRISRTVAAAMLLAAQSAFAATLTVSNTSDSGPGSLRQAILEANATAGADTIAFNISGAGVHTISPLSPLPALTDDAGVTIDGYTQPGSSPNTLAIGDNAVLAIEIDGSGAGSSAHGLEIRGLRATVRGLGINRFASSGIKITSGYGHQISGCFLGTDPAGQIARGNGFGLLIDMFSFPPAASTVPLPTAVIVGGLTTADRNLISGNSSAGLIGAVGTTNSLIRGNYIGTDASGLSALPNQGGGVALVLASVTLGGMEPAAMNVISGNVGSGVLLASGGQNLVANNRIGTDASGTSALPNGTGISLVQEAARDDIVSNLVSGNTVNGIRIFNSAGTHLDGNSIGTDRSGASPLGNGGRGVFILASSSSISVGAGSPNVIAYNVGSGVSIGFNASGASDATKGVVVSGNSIHDNGGLGIDLQDDGVTPGNACGSGQGPNLLQSSPVLTSAAISGSSTKIRGTLGSAANSAFTLEFFSNSSCDPSGFGEGARLLGRAPVATDASCHASFEVTLPVSVAPGSFITSTARDAAGNTSEFSACRPVGGIAGALVSEFFRNDPTAIAIAAGLTTRDINDFGLEAGWVQGDTRTFAYRVVSGYRQLGYSFPANQTGGDRPQEMVQSSFQAREGLPVTSTIGRQLLLRLDHLLSQREAADAPVGARFPLFSHMLDGPLNEPPKTHLAAIYTLAYENLPTALVPWTLTSFEYAFLIQGPPTIHDFGSPGFQVCDSFYNASVGFECVMLGPFVWDWNDDFSEANTLLHEYAHFLDGTIYPNFPGTASGTVGTRLFYDISFDTANEIVDGWHFYPRRSSSVADFVSGYAMGWAHNTIPGIYTAQEDFAESFAAYVLHGYVFRALALSNAALAAKYSWLRQNVFGGTEYDTGNRNYAAFFAPASRADNVIDYSRNDPGFVWDYRVGLLVDSGGLLLHGTGPVANPSFLFLDRAEPAAAASKYKESTGIEFARGNAWKEIGTWTGLPPASAQTDIRDLRTWIGLRNSDDTGTRYDLRAELYKNGVLVGSGVTRCIQGVDRNPDRATEVTVSFDPFPPTDFSGTDTLSLKILTRIGTNPDGSKCPGHGGAAGLRLYFDSVNRPSSLESDR